MTRLNYIILLLLLCCKVIAAPMENVDKVVAFVNDDVITASELNHQMDITKKQLLMDNQPLPDDKTLRKHVLNGLIDNSLQLQIAKKMEIKVDSQRVDAALKDIAKRNNLSVAQLKQQIESSEMSFAAYKKELRKQILVSEVQQNLVASKIVITPDQVKDFVALQKKELAKNKEYHLQHILLSLPDNPSTTTIQQTRRHAQQLYQQLQQGADFDKLVAKESSAGDALKSGDLGWLKLTELPAVFIKPAKQLKTNQISEPIQTSNGFHIVKLLGVKQKQLKHYSTQYHLRQIFMKADDLTSNQEVERKMVDIRKHLQRGEKFSEYAKTFSQDQKSASHGGDMGWMFADEVPYQVGQAITTAQLKSIKKPIRSNAGWHLIQVMDTRQVEDGERMLKNQARQLLYRQKMHIATQNWLQSIRSQAYVKVIKLES